MDIRFMRPQERGQVQQVGKESFSPFFGLLLSFFLWFSRDGRVLVAVEKDQILGATLLRSLRIGPHRIGLTFWIFVHPQAGGKGVGGRLLDQAQTWFSSQGAHHLLAAVDGYNTPSWLLFHRRGFRRMGPAEQFSQWGIWTPLVWMRSFHYIDLGHFLLWKGPEKTPPPRTSWKEALAAWLGISLALWLATRLSPNQFPILAVGLGVTILLHEGGQWWMARRLGLTPEFRIWESGLTLNLFLVPFGLLFPSYGGVYLKDPEHNYARDPEPAGRMAGTAIALTLLAGYVLALFAAWTGSRVIQVFLAINLFFNTAQILLVFPQFAVMRGRRLLNWRPALWWIALLALGILAFLAYQSLR